MKKGLKTNPIPTFFNANSKTLKSVPKTNKNAGFEQVFYVHVDPSYRAKSFYFGKFYAIKGYVGVTILAIKTVESSYSIIVGLKSISILLVSFSKHNKNQLIYIVRSVRLFMYKRRAS